MNLNGSPSAIAAFNDLPIKTVNGTVIYMRDVAHVHDGSPPQTNVVHVDGKSAVLLAVVKAGAASTLSIISDIKQLLPSVKSTLPAGLNLTAVGDQSVFVTSAVSGVIHEGAIAAGADRTDDSAVPRQLALDPDHHRVHPALDLGLGDDALLAR